VTDSLLEHWHRMIRRDLDLLAQQRFHLRVVLETEGPQAELRPGDPPTLSLGRQLLEEVCAGRRTGSAAAMSGAVRWNRPWPDLIELAEVVAALDPSRPWSRPGPPPASVPEPCPDLCSDLCPDPELRVVVVLGAPNDEHGVLSPIAADRVLAALRLVRATPRSRLVLTGGTGAQFNLTDRPHWAHCLDFLDRRGLAREKILGCVSSRHTYEDILGLRELLRTAPPPAEIVVVTSDFHAPRAGWLLRLLLSPTAVRGKGRSVAATIHPVRHPGLTPADAAARTRHEQEAFGRVVAAALLFGPDRAAPGLAVRP
jgi:uncharacterized SAM-binding protein YcdF (DUF218 family)